MAERGPMRLIRAADGRRMPWKNGGGETTEIAVSPASASLDAFDWRVSRARVGVSGPFSVFPGVDRTLSVLGPAGIVLDFGDRGSVRLDRGSPPYGFPADVAVAGRLLGDPVDDLNVMTRRGRFRHHVSRREVDGDISLSRRGDAMLVIVQARGRIALDGTAVTLAPGDAILAEGEGADRIDLHLDAPGALFVIDLWRAADDG